MARNIAEKRTEAGAGPAGVDHQGLARKIVALKGKTVTAAQVTSLAQGSGFSEDQIRALLKRAKIKVALSTSERSDEIVRLSGM